MGKLNGIMKGGKTIIIFSADSMLNEYNRDLALKV